MSDFMTNKVRLNQEQLNKIIREHELYLKKDKNESFESYST